VARLFLLARHWPGSILASFDDLEHFAHHASEPYLAAWKRFNQSVGADGSVGIWHETYLVPAKQYECMYGKYAGLWFSSRHDARSGDWHP
jgi:hypothetical protein